jgi:hypothetical protein
MTRPSSIAARAGQPGKSARRRGPLDYEHMREPLLPLDLFLRRLARSAVNWLILIGGSLAIGMLGYHAFGQLGWVDSLLNAAMILTGMGPVDRMPSDAGKLFASAYALFSGVMFLTSVGVLMAPAIHRVLHRFHLQADEDRKT